ncbi:MAG: hypothetical protein ABIH09_00325, partial [Candidatus Omnitrophota bacterium]
MSRHFFNNANKNNHAKAVGEQSANGLDAASLGFIEVQTNHKKRICLKAVAVFVAFTFFFQQVAYSFDMASFRPVSSQTSVVPQSFDTPESMEVTNYDVLSYKRRQGGVAKLLPSAKEQEEMNSYTPHYLKRQQSKHEELVRQKQDTEDIMLLLNNKGLRKQEYTDDLPLKKKKSSEGGGGIYYTLEDYGTDGKARQINVYEYEGGKAGGRLMELVSYDISGLDSSTWESDAEEIKPDEGDPFIGSRKELTDRESLTADRIIRRTIYSGEKSEEKIDYVLSGYDDDNVPRELTIYDYNAGEGCGDANLDETKTFLIKALDIDFESDDWKSLLNDDILTRRTVYKGAEEEEKVDYVFDSYLVNDEDENCHNRLSVYDYDKTGGSDTLDEVRTYCTTDLRQEEWLIEDESRMESVTVYTGEEDKEQVQYTLSFYFEDDEDFIPWERKDHLYDNDGKLIETKTFDISGLDESQLRVMGSGALEERAFFIGDKGHERIEYSYQLYNQDSVPQLRTNYTYDGRALTRVETYDISGRDLTSEECLQELSLYEGKSGEERIMRTISYYDTGKTLKSTINIYGQNARGIFFVSDTEETTYSVDGEVTERVETVNTLDFTDSYNIDREDKNGNVRTQNRKTYHTVNGVEKLNREEDVLYVSYTAKGRAREENRRIYVFDDNAVRVEIERQDIINHMFNPKGNAVRQTIHSYKIDEFGQAVYDTTTEVENHKFDYYGNMIDRSETVWQDMSDRSETSLLFHKTIRNEYENRLAQRRGNATLSEIIRYDSVEESAETEVDRTRTQTLEFDARGYAVKQITDTYVTDRLSDPKNPVRKLASSRETLNFEIDSRGDARRQEILAYKTDDAGEFVLDANKERISASFQVFTNREFDSQHNVINQMALTYDHNKENRSLLDVQEIRSIGFHTSGVALKQIIATYADEDKTDLLDVRVIENSNISSLGNAEKTVITRYDEGTIAGKGKGEISYTNPVDKQTIISSEFDLRGNSGEQTIVREYWDTDIADAGAFVFTEAQMIVNGVFDFHDRSRETEITNYRDRNLTDAAYKQKFSYNDYDQFGNVLEQTVNTYQFDEFMGEMIFTEHKVITSAYENAIAQRRGNATRIEIIRYTTIIDAEVLDPNAYKIDRILTEISVEDFDARGYAKKQTSKTYVMDDQGLERLTAERVTENFYINNRGDARSQKVTMYVTNAEGNFTYNDITNEKQSSTYQLYTNREFDSEHNVKNQMLLTCDGLDDTVLDVQEVRAKGFHSSGVALKQVIATYADVDKSEVLDVKVIENKNILANGNTETSIITRYADWTIEEEGQGNVVIDESSAIDRQSIVTKAGDYDVRGNAVKQSIIREYWDEVSKNFVFSEAQRIVNEKYDFHDRVEKSVVENYMDENFTKISDKQEIFNDEYDQYDNALTQRINTYALDELTQELVLADHKVITNEYGNSKARRRGSATWTEVIRYDVIINETVAIPDAHKIDRTVTITADDDFDPRGYAAKQTTFRYVMDKVKGECLSMERITENVNIDNRGDAQTQKILTYMTDENGVFLLEESKERVVSTYQILTNRKFDSQHNVKNHMILTYSEPDGILLDVQEIRSLVFHSSGTAKKQQIATYVDLAKTQFLDVKVVENSEIKATGMAGKSVVTKYSAWQIDDAGTGKITVDELSAEERVTTQTAHKDLDARGNALKQTVIKEYWDNGSFVFNEAQVITYAGYDIHDRVASSTIENYSDLGLKDLSDKQDILYEQYDKLGNVVDQTIDTYSPDEITGGLELVDHKVIKNEYNDLVAARRGFATETTVFRYDALGEQSETPEHLIERTYTITEKFDIRGFAEKQKTWVYTVDSANKEFLVSERITENINVNNRGDAEKQKVTLYVTDNDGKFIIDDKTKERVVTTYQEFTNREFDSEHNIKNQMVLTYNENGGILLDVQEVRALGFHSSGVSKKQIVATYTDAEKTKLLDVKIIDNSVISAGGNVVKSVITKYSSWQIEDNGSGQIIVDEKSVLDRQTIETKPSDFDPRGNALKQIILREYWDENASDGAGAFLFNETQVITHSDYDIHDRASKSVIENYLDAERKQLAGTQEIFYEEYDRFGNALVQRIDTYNPDEITDELILADHKVIENIYDDIIAERRGLTTETTVRRYNALGLENETLEHLIDRTYTVTNEFDARGYAEKQTSFTYVMDGAGKECLVTERVTENTGINNRGDADSQK